MVSKKKLEKIMRMMRASGIVDNFEGMLRKSAENIGAHLNELEKLVGDEDDVVGLDAASAYVESQIKKIKVESRELYLKELISKKEKILRKFALIYDRLLSEQDIDALYEMYSNPAWKKMVELQPVLQEEQFKVMSKFDISATKKVLEFAIPRELELRARCKAKRAFGWAVESGQGFEKALTAYGNKYREIMAEE